MSCSFLICKNKVIDTLMYQKLQQNNRTKWVILHKTRPSMSYGTQKCAVVLFLSLLVQFKTLMRVFLDYDIITFRLLQ